MLSKPIASGAMLVLLVGVVGAAALQSDDATPAAGVTQVGMPNEDVAPVEREASAPNRVVDSAGFPVTEDDARSGPVVTVNGRPLGQPAQAATGSSAVSSGERAQQPGPNYSVQNDDAPRTQTAVVEPPRPIPRPAGLTAAPRDPISTAGTNGQTAPSASIIDYDSSRDAPFSIPAEPPMTLDQRQDLLPPANLGNHPAAENGIVRDPERDELVGVVGPSGQVIWIYEEQLRNTDSRVTFQNNQPVQNPPPFQNNQPVNPFGFVYE